MEGMNTMSAADIAAVTRPNMYGGNADGFGTNSWIWLIALLFLGGGIGGFGGNARNGNAATVDELNSASNFARLENQVQGIGGSLAQGFRNVDNGLCQLGYQGLQNYANLSKEMASCCCETKSVIDGVRFDMANYNAGIQAAISAEGQKTRDLLQQNKIESLQAQINKLQLEQATGCLPRISPVAYGVYPYPTCNNNGCNGLF